MTQLNVSRKYWVMKMLEPSSIAQILQLYGGWGLSAILICGIVALYRHMGRLIEKRNEQFIELLRENASQIEQSNVMNGRVEDHLQKISNVSWDDIESQLKELCY